MVVDKYIFCSEIIIVYLVVHCVIIIFFVRVLGKMSTTKHHPISSGR